MPNEILAAAARKSVMNSIQTLRCIDETRELIAAELSDGGHCVIDCSRIEEADISIVQVLLSARLTAQRLGGSLRLIAPSPALIAVLERTGVPGIATDPFWNGAPS